MFVERSDPAPHPSGVLCAGASPAHPIAKSTARLNIGTS
jgi:hypothetical protein